MANSVTVKLEGVNGFLDRARLLVPRVKRAVQTEVATAALLIESDAKRLSPVDTGLNRAEIHTDFSADRLASRVSAGTEYAVFLEFGRKGQRAQPFLFPAYEKNRAAFVANLKAALKLF